MNARSHCAHVLTAALLTASVAAGADRFWTGGLGGDFADPSNWDDGGMGQPLSVDTAIFDIPSVFTVQFLGSQITDRVRLRSGIVTFAGSDALTYELLQSSALFPAIEVGAGNGDVAALVVEGLGLAVPYVNVATEADAFGSLRLADGASLSCGDVRIGVHGAGLFELVDGAVGDSGAAVIAQGMGAYGEALVTGASWSCQGALTVARFGAGSLTIEDGGGVDSGAAIVAQNDGAIGDVIVSGPGSHLTLDGSLDVGMRGFGGLTITCGAVVSCIDFAVIGTFGPPFGGGPGESGYGAVVIDGMGSTLAIDGGFFGGDLHVGLYGVGTLQLIGGGRVVAAGSLFGENNLEPNIITVTLAASDDYPLPALTVGGTVGLDLAARLVIALADGFVPEAGDAFAIISAADGVDTVEIVLPALPSAQQWAVTRTAERLDISVQPDDCIIDPGGPSDCNGNGVRDDCDIETGTSADCNGNGVPDECDIDDRESDDCNVNGIPDECDIALGLSADCDDDGVPDECGAIRASVRVTPSGALGGDTWGEAVAFDGAVLVMGNANLQEVRVFRRTDGVFVEEATLAADLPVGSKYGVSVHVSGNVVAVGAPGEIGDDGAVYVYRYDGKSWTEEDILVDGDGDESKSLGHSVGLSGDRLVAGARFRGDGTSDFELGAAYFYRFIGGGWIEQARRVISDADSSFVLPQNVGVDIAGDVAVLGVLGDQSGRAAIYRRVDSIWTLERNVVPPVPPDTAVYTTAAGVRVATDGTSVLIGGSRNEVESVFVVRYDGAEWVDDAVLQPFDPDGTGVRRFGSAVTVDDDVAVVGAPGNPETDDAGRAYVFRRTGGVWHQQGVLSPASAASGDGVGASVATDGVTAVIGVPGDDAVAEDAGAAYVFDDINADCTCPEDVDGSGDVGFTDLLAVIASWGPCPPKAPCPADVDGDGAVGFTDLLLIVGNWGPCA